MLELLIRQIDFGGDQRPVLKSLLAFIPVLSTLGEDKSSGGILGAIGLGKKSTLSARSVMTNKHKMLDC